MRMHNICFRGVIRKVSVYQYRKHPHQELWTMQNVVSGQDVHCLPLVHQFLDTSAGSKMDLSNFRFNMVDSL